MNFLWYSCEHEKAECQHPFPITQACQTSRSSVHVSVSIEELASMGTRKGDGERTVRSKSLTNSFLGVSDTPRAWFLKMTSSSHLRLTPNEVAADEDEMVEGAGEWPSAACRFRSGLRAGGGVSNQYGCAVFVAMLSMFVTHFPVAISSSRETCSLSARSRSCKRGPISPRVSTRTPI